MNLKVFKLIETEICNLEIIFVDCTYIKIHKSYTKISINFCTFITWIQE